MAKIYFNYINNKTKIFCSHYKDIYVGSVACVFKCKYCLGCHYDTPYTGKGGGWVKCNYKPYRRIIKGILKNEKI